MRFLRTCCAACVVALCVAVAGCGNGETERKTVVRPVVTVTVPDPETGRQRAFPGTARAAIETRLSFRVPGEIEELPARIGMRVRKGDLVARLDPTDYRLQVGRAEAATAQAEAALAQARADWERTRALYEVGNTSRRDLDRARAQFDASEASLKASRRQLELARQQLKYTVLSAPVDGALAEVPVDVHQTVAAGQPVALLTAGDRMQVEVGIPDSLITSVHAGDKVTVRFDALPGEDFPGAVIEVGVESRAVSTYPVKVALEQASPHVRAGMSGEAVFSFDLRETTMLVPPVAVAGRSGGERYVWIADPEAGTVSRRDVTVGQLTSRGLEVLSGLRPGERLVVRGVNSLVEGQRVRVMDMPSEEAAQ
ncbi:RND family efflux transporter MFP subunit [Desulfobaculum xiamenense]|uniref:RND family efflux transporter MFP subunit n=1 Tax=Desulfobaculum xiamenense TaxID=995050 RepID=A0A846QG11_9BACT|nr:efflux RND transporter periplasmic adaptor subunit [Desulfobaculum xiamenense]NJB67248.1 RND family efflux transporter MFP subunit [Desulfobaculum xiamenense]